MLLFDIITDLFRDREVSGWAKAGWMIALIFLPFLTALVYLGVHQQGNVEHHYSGPGDARGAVRQVGCRHPPPRMISKAKSMLNTDVLDRADLTRSSSRRWPDILHAGVRMTLAGSVGVPAARVAAKYSRRCLGLRLLLAAEIQSSLHQEEPSAPQRSPRTPARGRAWSRVRGSSNRPSRATSSVTSPQTNVLRREFGLRER